MKTLDLTPIPELRESLQLAANLDAAGQTAGANACARNAVTSALRMLRVSTRTRRAIEDLLDDDGLDELSDYERAHIDGRIEQRETVLRRGAS